MFQRPDVSIITAAYQAEATIELTIQSVQAQTLQNWELIIIDDGSQDNTPKIVIELAKKDDRIRLIQQANSGPSSARNRGIREARSNFIAFLDADDLWAPERLNGMIGAYSHCPSVGVLFSRTRFIHADTLQLGTLTPHVEELTVEDIMAENAVCSTSNIICRTEVLRQCGDFAEGLNFAEDQDWLLRVALHGRWKICGVDEEWFFYRSSPESQSADLEALRRAWIQMICAAANRYPNIAIPAARAAYAPFHRQLARRALRMSQPRTAMRYLISALRREPRILLRQPKRTVLTIAGTLVGFVPNGKLKELIAK